MVIKDILIKQALQDEASHFWKLQQADPGTQVPDTFNMKGYLLDMDGKTRCLKNTSHLGRIPEHIQGTRR